jgi:hypothetical protein
MRTPYRATLAECREAMRPFLDLCRFETKRGRLNNSPPRMAFTSRAKLGPYEILTPFGAGGIGEEYRARKARLAREVEFVGSCPVVLEIGFHCRSKRHTNHEMVVDQCWPSSSRLTTPAGRRTQL